MLGIETCTQTASAVFAGDFIGKLESSEPIGLIGLSSVLIRPFQICQPYSPTSRPNA